MKESPDDTQSGRQPRQHPLRWALLGSILLGCTLQTVGSDGPTEEASWPDLELHGNCTVERTETGYRVDCETEGSGASTSIDANQHGDALVVLAGATGSPTVAPSSSDSASSDPDLQVEWSSSPSGASETSPPKAVTLDACDESPHTGATWNRIQGPHIVLHTLSGTAAGAKAPEILSRYETVYDNVRTALDLAEEPEIQFFLSPSRTAADYHEKRFGVALTSQGIIEALYVDSPHEFERLHPGYLLTRTLAAQLVPPDHFVLPVLARGLGELLDQSDRDLHLSYAYELVTGQARQAQVATLSDGDLEGSSGGIAGSLVQYIVDSYGMPAIEGLIRASAVAWDGGYEHAATGPITSGADLDRLFADVMPTALGASWAEVRAGWQQNVVEYLKGPLPELEVTSSEDVRNLVALADLAINTDDADLYRTTMEGFYCLGWSDEDRLTAASRMVASYEGVETRVLKIYPTPTRHFQTARVLATRTFGDGITTTTYYDAERMPDGWRFTWAPEW